MQQEGGHVKIEFKLIEIHCVSASLIMSLNDVSLY